MSPSFDQATWQAHVEALGLVPSEEGIQRSFARLYEAYTAPSRHYHDDAHIADCLTQLHDVWDQAHAPATIALAIWYHDVVYESRRPDNEEQSAIVAQEELEALGASLAVREHVAWLVLCTKHHKVPPTPPVHPDLTPDAMIQDSLLLNDIDLSILGRQEQVFMHYDEAIRREFAWVEEEPYRQGRMKVLEAFLQRETLYHTSSFAQRFDAQARANLARALTQYQRRDTHK